MPRASEAGVGHFLIGEAVFVGLEDSVRTKRALMEETRTELGIATE